MKSGWTVRRIGEVCDLMTGGTPSREKKEYFVNGNIKWLVSGDIHSHEITDCEGRITDAGMKNSNAKLLPVNSVMIALNGQGKTRGTVALLRTQATCNQSLVSIYPRNPSQLLPEYIYFNLYGRYEELRKMTGDDGNDRRGLNMILIRDIQIPVPPLPEQQRIVALLDQAFAGIATAKANAEKNLQNARELFDSYFENVLSKPHDGWIRRQLHDVCFFDKKLGNFTDLPYVGLEDIEAQSSRFIGTLEPRNVKSTTFHFDNNHILYGRLRPYLNKVLIPDFEGHCSTEIFPIKVNAFIEKEFLLYWLVRKKIVEEINKTCTGARMPRANMNEVLTFFIEIPPISEQKEIVQRVENLSNETKKLEGLFQLKLSSFDELRKSILHKAFAGELTEG